MDDEEIKDSAHTGRGLTGRFTDLVAVYHIKRQKISQCAYKRHELTGSLKHFVIADTLDETSVNEQNGARTELRNSVGGNDWK